MAPYKQEPYLVLIGLDSAHHLCQRHFVRCTHHVRNIMLALHHPRLSSISFQSKQVGICSLGCFPDGVNEDFNFQNWPCVKKKMYKFIMLVNLLPLWNLHV